MYPRIPCANDTQDTHALSHRDVDSLETVLRNAYSKQAECVHDLQFLVFRKIVPM